MCGVCVCVSQRRVSRVCVVVGVGVHASSPIRVWAGSMKNVYFAGAGRWSTCASGWAGWHTHLLLAALCPVLDERVGGHLARRTARVPPRAHPDQGENVEVAPPVFAQFRPSEEVDSRCEHAQHRRRGRPRPQTGTGTATSSVPSDSARAELGYPTPGSQCSRNRRPLVALKLRSDFFTTLAGLVLQQCRSS